MADIMTPAVAITRHPEPGMVTLRCDLTSAALASALPEETGCPLPDPRRIVFSGEIGVAWMASDELMIFCPQEQAPCLAERLNAALAGEHALVLDVSDARAVFRIEGEAAREVIAKGAPVDLAATAFGPGDFRRTRLGQIAAAIWMPQEDRIDLMCFRSVGDHVAQWIETAARDGAFPGLLH